MYDMFDLPNETELAQIILEAKKQPRKTDTTIDVKDIFPFSTPTPAKSKVVSDKTGVVKPKVDFRDSDVATAWEKFLGNMKAKKAETKGDDFGRLEVKNGEKIPSVEKISNTIKALKTTKVTGLNGKSTSETEVLGVFKEMAKTSATKLPDKTGVVEPKDGLGKIDKKPKFDVDASAEVVVKTAIPSKDNKMVDKTGVVKPKDGLGKIDAKPKIIDMTGTTVVVKDAIPSKDNKMVDKSGAVKPKKLEPANVKK
jgi:hypothetical protein